MKKIGLYGQMLLSIAVVVLFVVFIFNRSVLAYLELIMGLNLLVMGYNNYQVYKRKNFTLYYIVFGIVMLVLSILRFVGV